MRWRGAFFSWLVAVVGACEGKSPELCTGGEDEDQDGTSDCDDSDCWVVGGVCPEICATTRFDEDGDGYEACQDSDCWVPGGMCPEACDTEDDEDADGLTLCDDPDCWIPSAGCEQRCDGDDDQDGDGLRGCADPDCWLAENDCPEACTSVGDEDADGLVDCDDDDCFAETACIPTFADELQPVFLTHCAGAGGACHSRANQLGGLSFDSYDDLPLPSVYCAGMTKAECSLFRILEPSMPEDCLGCVPPDDVALIERWVDAGFPP